MLTDAYGNKYTHGWLPVDEKTGQISFTYKGVTYADNSVWEGLERIQSDVRDLDRPLSDLYEALSLVNSWYVDKTTKAKPDNIKNYIQEVGLEKIYTNLGIRTWFISHNPLNTLITKGIDFLVRQGKFMHVSVDKGMSWKKFADLGGYVLVTNGGIKLRGYDSLAFSNIVDSPDTAKLEKDEKGYSVKTTWKNELLPASEFLSLMEEQLRGELNKQEKNALTILTQPRLNFADLKALQDALRGIVEEVTPGAIKIINDVALKNELIDKLAYDATFNPNQDVVSETRKLIKGIAASLGIKSASVYDLYVEKARDPRNYTYPAINIRFMAYDTARAVFESALKNRVGATVGVPIFEIAKSEIGYTGQRPAEYTTSVLAAAIKEGWRQAVHLQGDHFQIAAKDYLANPEKARDAIKQLIREAIEAGFYQIDLDMSTLVDWSKPTADEQQRANYTETALLTKFVRDLERELGLDRQGIVVNLGGEIGEIGMGLEKGKERNSSVEDIRAFMDGYRTVLNTLSQEAGYELRPITKVAVQSGTKHGGIRDAQGKPVGKVKVGFNTLAELGKVARQEYGLAGVVQHGASTLPPDYFTVFAGKDVPRGAQIDDSLLSAEGQQTLHQHPVAEVHLATAYQDTTLDHSEFPGGLRNAIQDYILAKYPPKEGQDPQKALAENRKNAAGPFKVQLWNLPEANKVAIRNSLRRQFDAVFNNLGVATASSAIQSKQPLSSAELTVDLLAQRITHIKGARTGEVHLDDAISEGATGIIAGHSETRANFAGEDNQQINEQIKAAVNNPKVTTIILAVGETAEEKMQGKSLEVVRVQLTEGLAGLGAGQIVDKLIIAYEPRWAIKGSGYGKPAQAQDAQDMAAYIRGLLGGLFNAEAAKKARILYGGSADKSNARDYLSQPDVDGLLVGTASTKIEELKAIVELAQGIGEKEGRVPYIGANWKTYLIPHSLSEFAEALRGVDRNKVQVGIAPSLSRIGSLSRSVKSTMEEASSSPIIKDELTQLIDFAQGVRGEVKNVNNVEKLVLGSQASDEFADYLRKNWGLDLSVEDKVSLYTDGLDLAKLDALLFEAMIRKNESVVAPDQNLEQPVYQSPWGESSNPGGIDLERLKNINTTPNSSPVNFDIPFDPNNFYGFSFQIVSLEKIEDLDSVFAASSNEEGKQLAYLKVS